MVITMKKGIAIMLGGGDEPAPAESEDEGMDVQNEERRSALRAFFQASQNGDVEAGMKAWARMGDCGPPPVQAESEDEGEDIGPEETTKPARRGLYRE